MKTETRPAAICGACGRAATCKHPRDPGRPVLWCEEFKPDKSRRSGNPRARTTQTPEGRGAIGGSDDPAGLCVNCDNRRQCEYPKPEGGVWYCEEYA